MGKDEKGTIGLKELYCVKVGSDMGKDCTMLSCIMKVEGTQERVG